MSNVAARWIDLLLVPYDSGHRGRRMGAGPEALVDGGAARRLAHGGRDVRVREILSLSTWSAELRTAFELYRQTATHAAWAHDEGRMPLLLAGNCGAAIGMVAALQAHESSTTGRRVGLVWLDAHGDFNTPETDLSGFLDGQALAMVVGRCWQGLTSTIPGFAVLPEHRVLLLGSRALDPDERAALVDSQITWLPQDAAVGARAVAGAVSRLLGDVDVVHVHVDLDVYDPSIAPANGYAQAGGLSASQVRDALEHVARRIPVASASLASYDAAYDSSGRLLGTALDLLTVLAHLIDPTPDG